MKYHLSGCTLGQILSRPYGKSSKTFQHTKWPDRSSRCQKKKFRNKCVCNQTASSTVMRFIWRHSIFYSQPLKPHRHLVLSQCQSLFLAPR